MSEQGSFLATDRLEFRRWARDDLTPAMLLWGDPEVTRLFAKEPLGEEQVKERLWSEIAHQEAHGVSYWPVLAREGWELVGCCGLHASRPEERVYELGYHLRPAWWGKGIAAEAARAVVGHAFSHLGASALVAGHHPENVASGRVLAKLGFERAGEQWYAPTGLVHPSYVLRPRG